MTGERGIRRGRDSRMGRLGSTAFGLRVLFLSVRALTRGGNQPGPVVNSAEEAARAEAEPDAGYLREHGRLPEKANRIPDASCRDDFRGAFPCAADSFRLERFALENICQPDPVCSGPQVSRLKPELDAASELRRRRRRGGVVASVLPCSIEAGHFNGETLSSERPSRGNGLSCEKGQGPATAPGSRLPPQPPCIPSGRRPSRDNTGPAPQ